MSVSEKMRVGGYYHSPLFGELKFGVSCLDEYSSGKPHKALDATQALGTWLYAPRDCVVLDVYDRVPNPPYASTGSGKPCNGVVLGFESSAGNKYSMSLHHGMKGIPVKKGQRLKAGDKVMRLGITGNTSGPHLHANIWKGWGTWDNKYDTLWNPSIRVSGKTFDSIIRLDKKRSDVIKKTTPSKRVRRSDLKYGRKNTSVKRVQLALRALGADYRKLNPSGATGQFGNETRAMIALWRKKNRHPGTTKQVTTALARRLGLKPF